MHPPKQPKPTDNHPATHTRHAAAAVLCAASLISLPALALQPLITDDTGTQGASGNQLELSLSQVRAKTDGMTERAGALPFVYTRGVTDTLDLYAGIAWLRLRPADGGDNSGFSNPVLGAKWRFMDGNDAGTSAAVKLEALAPVSGGAQADGLGSGRAGGLLTFIVSQDVPFGAIHLNAGIGRIRYADAANNPDETPLRLSVAPVWRVNEQWQLALDVGAESVRSGGAHLRTAYAELGAIWSPREDLDFALGVIHSRDNANPDTRTLIGTAGLTWRFK